MVPPPPLQRSQPPFLTLMMREYMEKTAEVDFLRRHLPTLEREVEFWENKRSIMVSGKVFVQNSFKVPKMLNLSFAQK